MIQQIDIHTGLVMWEWHSLGHVDVSRVLLQTPRDRAAGVYDYFHINSLDASTSTATS